MIDHTGVVVSDAVKSRKFYESALAALGYAVLMEIPTEYTNGKIVVGYGVAPKPDFWTATGAPNEPRLHTAFRAENRAQVDAFHRAAIAAGGVCNGPPGPRPHYHQNYYGAFVLDPEGTTSKRCATRRSSRSGSNGPRSVGVRRDHVVKYVRALTRFD